MLGLVGFLPIESKKASYRRMKDVRLILYLVQSISLEKMRGLAGSAGRRGEPEIQLNKAIRQTTARYTGDNPFQVSFGDSALLEYR